MKPILHDSLEKYQEIIELLGEEKVERIYFIMGSAKVSFATIRKLIREKRILESINDGFPFQKIALKDRVSKMTVYRYIRKTLRK